MKCMKIEYQFLPKYHVNLFLKISIIILLKKKIFLKQYESSL